ncbi:hypothetical protein M8744_14725 [Lutimaribacter sp. EGI FJ00013]|uniref:Uncharacterized protein n=1 Tax=Lutimaribacter degradans TaxID=2945989 RepID=A0ACC5ZYF4_9RHOB|nr:hypothetical protein [Lutimaribacter sp. EGI FJ00013]MCM2563408.1 hypothetical protein [Lutimaribacter sp. EGI FJ00013]
MTLKNTNANYCFNYIFTKFAMMQKFCARSLPNVHRRVIRGVLKKCTERRRFVSSPQRKQQGGPQKPAKRSLKGA